MPLEQKIKARVMDAAKIRKSLLRMTSEILERNRDLNNLVIVGIRTRGIYLGNRISRLVGELENVEVPVGVLDITPYRDDAGAHDTPGPAGKTGLPFPIGGKDVLLVDDVMFTGRTIRAAMDGLFHLGRPGSIQLLILIDRGHRELPIRADYAGKVLPTSRREIVQVKLMEIDGVDEVLITEPAEMGQ
jgi:pyrimidine operon attenuation protein/uracil phosphoribosyltransferase